MVAAPSLRLVFFGTPAFAVPSLEGLCRSRHAVVMVVAQPDKPHGRGQRAGVLPVKALALSAGLAVAQPERLRAPGFLDELRAARADLGVVAAYGKILPVEVLAAPRLGMVNVHASLLPRHRGAAPVHRAVIAGDRETGVTLVRMIKALDAGPVLAARRRPIGPNETSGDIERDLALMGSHLLIASLDDIAAGRAPEMPQDESRATYAPRLRKEEGLVDWSQTAEQVHRLIRGLHPWPHAFSFLQGRRVILLRSDWTPGPMSTEPPGTVVEAEGSRLVVAAASGAVQVIHLQLEGRRPMTARELIAGHRVAPGDRFGGP